MGCLHSTEPDAIKLDTIHREVHDILHALNVQHHWGIYTVSEYAITCLYDAHIGTNISIEDNIRLDRLWYICEHYPFIGHIHVHDIIHGKCSGPTDTMVNNMLDILSTDDELMDWFMAYSPPHYAFNTHPNIEKLAKMVQSDNHTEASFALCCRAIKNKLK